MPGAPRLPRSSEREQIEAAGRGDEGAFGRLIEPFQPELLAHCYRMLGSVHDAEEALQEALLRAWSGLAKFEGRSSLRSWLYRIATNTSLDIIGRRPKSKVLPLDHGPATDPHDGPGAPLIESIWIEPYPDGQLGLPDGLATPEAVYEQRESVELAFIAVLQHLPPSQRAALILREVLGFSAREVAATLETTTAAVNSSLQRARKAVDDHLPEQSQQQTLRALGDKRLREIVVGYADAWERGDVDAVAAMLTEDAVLAMPPMPTWYRGIDDVLVFIRDWAFSGRVYEAEGNRRVKVLATTANGQIAFGTYSWDDEHETHLPTVLQVLTLRGDRIAEIMGFVEPSVFRSFGLPAEIPA